VARIQKGEIVWLFDETGTSYLARVEDIRATNTFLSIIKEREDTELKTRITLAQSIVKMKKMDLIIQKTTELGVSVVIPVIAARTVVKLEDKADKKQKRWQKIALEASKQCGRNRLPQILRPQSLMATIQGKKKSKKLFLSDTAGRSMRDILIEYTHENSEPPPSSVVVLVGPEGGWTDEEETAILEHEFEAVKLGRHVLRSETAAIAATVLIDHFWNT
jgi:16S rRNA (uracil1498-N3)-methyltransferase